MDVCLRVLKESNKSRFDSYSVRNSVLIISHIYLLGLLRALFFLTTFLEVAIYWCVTAFVLLKLPPITILPKELSPLINVR